MHAPLPMAPQPGQVGRGPQPGGVAGAYGRRIGK